MRDTLGHFEYQVLATLQLQPRDAYGVTIRARIKERTGREPSVGALYTTLERLEEKGFIRSQVGESTPERGGRAKKYFAITGAGVSAVRRTEAQYSAFSQSLAPQGT
ncbi:PadR family transcriptional regulator [Caulobacter sp. 1776]|uniref:PadR family transcriptional regulator n=1 Tax=Caulobacter sp. 1776 TaxID=3156420 RepID=UPI003398236A